MEIKQPPPKAMASVAWLGSADSQITFLSQKILPSTPHLFSVPTKTPYQPTFAHENLNTPFDSREVMALQYMTLLSSGDRGVGHTAANWQDDMDASPPLSAGAQSSSGTPNANRDPKKPSVKMSIADYKNRKSTGLKPRPGPTPTPELKRESDANDYRPGHARHTSSTSIDTPMARASSLEGENILNGAVAPVKAEQKSPIPVERTSQSHPSHSEREEKSRAPVNGLSTKDITKGTSSKPSNEVSKEHVKHPLPPRPQSPGQTVEPKQQKRPSDSGDSSHTEKRVKVERGETRNPSNPQNSNMRKSEPNLSSKPSPSQKSSVSRPMTSSPSKKAAAISTKQVETKSSTPKSTEKPLKIPKILSPLPDDLIIPPESDTSFLKMPTSNNATPSGARSKGTSPDTIVVKTSRPRDSASATTRAPPSKSTDELPPFRLPKLLSPDLPDIVEAELLRLKEKASNSLNTVESRHEKVRQPGAPGVAQKTQRPKVGHPPKKIRTELPRIEVQDENAEPVNSRIVKIRYKKRIAKDIQRILALPSKSVKKREAEDRIRESSGSSAPPARDTSDSEEAPIASRRSAKAPAGTTGQKRPISLSDTKEPAAKRPKGSEHADLAKISTPITPAFKSPNVSASKEKAQLATPKKGDAVKSISMRKVDSNEGQAHTPQEGNISTPASAEKSRIAGLAPQIVSHELGRASQEHSKFFPLGTTLKRKMDAMLKQAETTENDRKSGIMIGIEALLCYMISFHASDKISKFRNQAPQQENWAQFFPLWTFMEKKTPQLPELHTLVEQLGAVSREQWNKANIEQPQDKRDWDKTVANLRERDRLWAVCKRNEHLILNLGVTSTLGPWSSVGDAVGFGVATLTRYAEKQSGLEWKQDPNLSSSYMRKFIGEDA